MYFNRLNATAHVVCCYGYNNCKNSARASENDRAIEKNYTFQHPSNNFLSNISKHPNENDLIKTKVKFVRKHNKVRFHEKSDSKTCQDVIRVFATKFKTHKRNVITHRKPQNVRGHLSTSRQNGYNKKSHCHFENTSSIMSGGKKVSCWTALVGL